MDIESQQLITPPTKNQTWLKWIPVFGLVVSSGSFLFALGVLYPWHLELSSEFKTLTEVCRI